jgi:membrane protease YdiL (CAAX protease family)
MINSLKTDEPIQQSDFYQSWAERHGFSHAGIALLWIVTAFFLFQLFANFAGIALVIIREGIGLTDITAMGADKLMDMVGQNLDLIFVANSTGQILFLALATWFFCRLQVTAPKRPEFLRLKFRENTPLMIGMVILIILVAQPAIWFLGWLNSLIPVPESMEMMQIQQMEMIQNYLTGDGVVWVALLNIGLVPAVCEEILFRGYVQRSFEKSWGIWAAIIVSGLIFGAYHMQLSNLLPLAAIGILLAVMTWASQSIYPAMVAHLVNNGGSVLLGKYYPETAFAELSPESMPPIWMVFASGLLSAYLIYIMINKQPKPQSRPQGVSHD